MITLYHAPHTGSFRILWLLEELGAPYTIEPVTIRRLSAPPPSGEMTGARDPSNPHPHGKVPAIAHAGQIIFESTAIALYLTDAFPENGIGPTIKDPARGAYLSWLAYCAGVMEPAMTSKFLRLAIPEAAAGWAPWDEVRTHLQTTLEAGPHVLGENFSAVDILIAPRLAALMQYARALLPETAAIEAYVKRCTDRPGYVRAQAKDAS